MTRKKTHFKLLSDLVEMTNADAVMREIRHIVGLMHPSFDFTLLDKMFVDIVSLFDGRYPGYQECNTEYHDLKHTTDATLAMVRLMHGAFLSGAQFSEHHVELGVAATLFHDVGYIQERADHAGTGAKFTRNHIDRSIDFMEVYFAKIDLPREDFEDCRAMLYCTGLTTRIHEISFRGELEELLGKMLGTADLLGQMADRTYLEKLLFLFHEFREADIPGMNSELEMLAKTLGFYELTQKRFKNELSEVSRYMLPHFVNRWGIEGDLYALAIENHMKYLRFILENHQSEYRNYLRRGGLIDKIPQPK